MKLLYGGYQIADNGAARFQPVWQLVPNAAGVGYALAYRWEASDLAIACTPATAPTVIAAIEAVLKTQDRDLIFTYPDGTPTGKGVATSSTLTGVRCTRMAWSDRPGAQHWTHLSYAATFEWETVLSSVLAVNPERFLVDFSEDVSVRGGGAYNVKRNPFNAAPVVQTTLLEQGYTAVQEGRAVGLGRYPTPPPPQWSLAAYSNGEPVVTRGHPRRAYNSYIEYPVSWRYVFAFGGAVPPLALPWFWVGDPALPLPPVTP